MARIFQRQIIEGRITMVRGAGSLIGAANSALPASDSATLTDANIPPAQMFNACGYDSIFLGVDIAGGTAATMSIQLLFRDRDALDTTASPRWRTLLVGSRDGITTIVAPPVVETTGQLGNASAFIELRTYGHKWLFPRIVATGGTLAGTTGWAILAKGGRRRPAV